MCEKVASGCQAPQTGVGHSPSAIRSLIVKQETSFARNNNESTWPEGSHGSTLRCHVCPLTLVFRCMHECRILNTVSIKETMLQLEGFSRHLQDGQH